MIQFGGSLADREVMSVARDHRGVDPLIFRSLFEDHVDGMLLTNPDSSVFAANRAACRLLRLTEAEICALGRNGLADTTDPRWAIAVEARRRDGRFRGQLRMRRGDGTTLEVELTSAMLRDEGELRSYVSFTDASASVELLERTARDQRAAASVVETLESISDAYFAVDSNWNLTYINRRAEQRLKLDRRVALGGNLWTTVPSATDSGGDEHCREAMRTGQPVTFIGYSPSLGLRSEMRAHPLTGGGLGVYLLDITDRFAVEQARDQLLDAERAARGAAELAQVKLAHRATHDPLTGLLNRLGLLEAIAALVADDPGLSLTVMFIDLDQFKLVNDTLGHAIGDELLQVFAQRLGALLAPGQILARFGGDEFIVALPSTTVAAATALAGRIIAASQSAVTLGDSSLLVTASIGLARAERDPDIGVLLREADAALYSAKESGRTSSSWFDQRLLERAVRRVSLEHGLREALAQDALTLDYQPAFDLTTGAATHIEALARWRDPTGRAIPPSDFIPVAEESGLIAKLGEWAIAQAVAQAAAWAHVPGLRVWVNVSPRQLVVPGLTRLIAAHLDRAGVSPDRFGIEVTESTLGEPGQFTRELCAVSDLGVAIAVDDFGTGFSSLARLVQMPVDVLKIDRSFVVMLGTARGDALLGGIVTLAHSVGAYVIAEGVETVTQLPSLTELGCDAAAGFFLARPGPAPAMRWTIEV